MITRERAIILLKKLDACQDSSNWFEYSEFEPEQAWNQCPNPYWLAWLSRELKVDQHKILSAACECAKAVIHLISEEEQRPRQALELADRWLAGEDVSVSQFKDAVDEALAAADVDTASLAADAAAHACYAVALAAYATVNYVAHVAVSSIVHARVAYARAADPRIDLPGSVRKHITWALIEKKLKKL